MKRLNNATKKAQTLLQAYKNATKTDIRDCYSSHCSDAKVDAQKQIMQAMHDLNGHGYKVCSSNPKHFSCAYVYPDTETGELVLRYETRLNTYETIFC